MFVANDLRPLPSNGAAGPTRRLVPAPHKASPSVAARPGSGAPNGVAAAAAAAASSSAVTEPAAPPAEPRLNGISTSSALLAGGRLPAPLAPLNGSAPPSGANGSAAPGGTNGASAVAPPAVVQQLVSLQSSNKMVSAELVTAQRTVAQQSLEMKGMRSELA